MIMGRARGSGKMEKCLAVRYMQTVGIVKLLRESLDKCRFTSFGLYDKLIIQNKTIKGLYKIETII